jgi:hypothetical protein
LITAILVQVCEFAHATPRPKPETKAKKIAKIALQLYDAYSSDDAKKSNEFIPSSKQIQYLLTNATVATEGKEFVIPATAQYGLYGYNADEV